MKAPKKLLQVTKQAAGKAAKENANWCCRGWLYQPTTPQQLVTKQK